jgi:hypothetical protein
MNFKKFAAFGAALLVIALGIWACSDYAGIEVTPLKKELIYTRTSLGLSDSIVLVLSNDNRMLAYLNTINAMENLENVHFESLSLAQQSSFDSISQNFLDALDVSYSDSLFQLYLQHLGYPDLAYYRAAMLALGNIHSSVVNDTTFFGISETMDTRNEYFWMAYVNLDEHSIRRVDPYSMFAGPVYLIYTGNPEIDGGEQMGWWARWRCRRACRKIYGWQIQTLEMLEYSQGLSRSQKIELSDLYRDFADCLNPCKLL